jgi:phage gp36-like protein
MPVIYVRQSDLYARFGEDVINQLADTDGTGTPDPLVISRVAEDASSEIDLALRGRYRLPIQGRVPEILTRLAADLALLFLHPKSIPDAVQKRADATRAILRQIAEGRMLLGLPPADDAAPMGGMVEIKSGRKNSPFASPGIRNQGSGIRGGF